MRHAPCAGTISLLVLLSGAASAGPLEGAGLALPPLQEASAAGQETRGAEPEDRVREGPTRVHPEAREAIDRLKSPFCPGFMLEVCPSPQAEALRDSLDARARRGIESDSLVALVLAAYGEEWRAVPEMQGRGLVAWVVPPLVLLVGMVGLIIGLRRVTGAPAREAEEGPDISEEERERLGEALHELESEEEPLF